jgi:MOSC domain-containing protein YiiM
MHVVSLNLGMPREVIAHDRLVLTGIFKSPVEGKIHLRRLNFDGDGQADLRVHGGKDKAVYAYPSEHYGYWREELPEMDLPWGVFGENLTTVGLSEEDLHIGDRLRIGEAILRVAQPRLPCYKLGIRFGRDDIIKRFLASGRSGFYFAVDNEGEIGAGDPIEIIDREPHHISIADLNRLITADEDDRVVIEEVLAVESLPQNWRDHFMKRLKKKQ